MKGSDKRQTIKDYLEGTDDEDFELYFADGFDDAIIGYDSQTKKIVYLYNQMIQVMRQEITALKKKLLSIISSDSMKTK